MADVAGEVESLVQRFYLLRCSPLKAVSNTKQPVYITQIAVGQETNVLAVGGKQKVCYFTEFRESRNKMIWAWRSIVNILGVSETSGIIRLCKFDDFTPIGNIYCYNRNITGLEFSKDNENLLWSSGSDTEMICWDLRKNLKTPAQQLSSPNNSRYTCCGVNCTGDLVAGATEPCGDDVSMYIWDLRSSQQPLTSRLFRSVISDSHKDDITQIKFHPTKPNNMASCSTDGLICLFDVTHTEEDDALQWVLNSLSSVARIGYYGPQYDKLYCVTHIETLQLWDAEEASLLAEHSNIRDVIEGVEPVEYLVDCFYQPSNNQLYLFGGRHSGSLQLFDVKQDTVHRLCSLSGGHTATVRCLDCHIQSERIVTGGEDSAVCYWKAGSPERDLAESVTQEDNVNTVGKAVSEATNKVRMHGCKPYERPATTRDDN